MTSVFAFSNCDLPSLPILDYDFAGCLVPQAPRPVFDGPDLLFAVSPIGLPGPPGADACIPKFRAVVSEVTTLAYDEEAEVEASIYADSSETSGSNSDGSNSDSSDSDDECAWVLDLKFRIPAGPPGPPGGDGAAPTVSATAYAYCVYTPEEVFANVTRVQTGNTSYRFDFVFGILCRNFLDCCIWVWCDGVWVLKFDGINYALYSSSSSSFSCEEPCDVGTCPGEVKIICPCYTPPDTTCCDPMADTLYICFKDPVEGNVPCDTDFFYQSHPVSRVGTSYTYTGSATINGGATLLHLQLDCSASNPTQWQLTWCCGGGTDIPTCSAAGNTLQSAAITMDCGPPMSGTGTGSEIGSCCPSAVTSFAITVTESATECEHVEGGCPVSCCDNREVGILDAVITTFCGSFSVELRCQGPVLAGMAAMFVGDPVTINCTTDSMCNSSQTVELRLACTTGSDGPEDFKLNIFNSTGTCSFGDILPTGSPTCSPKLDLDFDIGAAIGLIDDCFCGGPAYGGTFVISISER